MQNDTICALATALGGAIGLIRISGPAALSAVSAVCPSIPTDTPANTIRYARIIDHEGATLDEAMVSIFRAPHSYTGEDAAEISCHGSPYVVQRTLDLLVRAGCRMARAGEYTQRAYLNGKLDLSQAEAVADLIAATNRATHQMALSQLRGGISSELATLRDQLLRLTSLLELELDFSDHEDLQFADRTELLQLTDTIDRRIGHLARSFETGQALKQGIPVALVGQTNAGKSTLLNRLLKDDRAIVSDQHGTTRDTVEETMVIRGVQFRLIDTAGLRQTTDTVELIGIERTRQVMQTAPIVVWVIDDQYDGQCPPFFETTMGDTKDNDGRYEGQRWELSRITMGDTEDNDGRYEGQRWELSRTTMGDTKVIAVWNKTDQTPPPHPTVHGLPLIPISAKTGHNIAALEQAIYDAANLPTLSESDPIVSSARQYDLLRRAQEHLQRTRSALNSGLSGDLVAEDLRQVLDTLAEVTGQTRITPQDTLNNIFSHFCIGK